MAAIAVMLAAVSCPVAGFARDRTISFAGEVARGETFTRALPGGLTFMLKPVQSGWHIWVGDAAHKSESYSDVATPPYHGVNPLQVHGWHFRNSDNTGPNDAGPKNVNAPGEVRNFDFVLSQDDYRVAREAMWEKPPRGDFATRLDTLDRIEKGDGVLRIRTLELGNLATGKRAWVERMAFTVDLTYLPKNEGRSRQK